MLIVCPHCSQKMKGPSSNIGTTARCPRCGKSFTVSPAHPPTVTSQPAPAGQVIEGTPIGGGTWESSGSLPASVFDTPAPSRRDKAAAILTGMVGGEQPVAQKKEKQNWYVVLTDYEMDGPYTGEEIIAAIRRGELKADTRLQRGESRTTVADLTARLRKTMQPNF